MICEHEALLDDMEQEASRLCELEALLGDMRRYKMRKVKVPPHVDYTWLKRQWARLKSSKATLLEWFYICELYQGNEFLQVAKRDAKPKVQSYFEITR
ncbi:hypothetical protein QYF36_024000 [Acer negundo]|nr:hypothetical protein QYF36_024000 [Acer negundo]